MYIQKVNLNTLGRQKEKSIIVNVYIWGWGFESDSYIKWLDLKFTANGYIILHFGPFVF